MVFSWYSGFLHQWNWQPRYNWDIVESAVKHHSPNNNPFHDDILMLCFVYKCIFAGIFSWHSEYAILFIMQCSFCWGSLLLIFLVFCVVLFVLFVFALCLVYPMFSVFMNCPFLITLAVFSNVYFTINTTKEKIENLQKTKKKIVWTNTNHTTLHQCSDKVQVCSVLES